MVLDATLLNTQHYKVKIKGKSGAIQGKKLRPLLHLDVVAIEKEAFWSPSTSLANFTFTIYIFIYYVFLTIQKEKLHMYMYECFIISAYLKARIKSLSIFDVFLFVLYKIPAK